MDTGLTTLVITVLATGAAIRLGWLALGLIRLRSIRAASEPACALSLARETLVDEATIAHTRDRRAYAAALLEFSTARPRLIGATALIGRRHLERRVALIAQEVSMPRSSLAVRIRQ